MSAALLDDLLAGYIAPVRLAIAALTPAKTANSANREHSYGLEADSGPANGLRKSANPGPVAPKFAGIRSPSQIENRPQSKETCGSSQDSRNSQGYPLQLQSDGDLDLAAVAWSDADIARFLDRRARLIRWGWAEPDAEALAERLVGRDREHDGRVNCTDCRHYRPGRCGDYRRAGLHAPDVGRDLAAMLQRCPGFDSAR